MAKRKAEDAASGSPSKKVASGSWSRNVQMIRRKILDPMQAIFERWQKNDLEALAVGGIQGVSEAAYKGAMKKDGVYACVVAFHQIGLVPRQNHVVKGRSAE